MTWTTARAAADGAVPLRRGRQWVASGSAMRPCLRRAVGCRQLQNSNIEMSVQLRAAPATALARARPAGRRYGSVDGTHRLRALTAVRASSPNWLWMATNAGWAGRPVLDVDTNNTILNDGCGGVWTSPTIIERDNVEIVAVADCHFESPPPYNERVLALNIADGSTKWVFFPPRGDDPDCDFDFGASGNPGPRSTGCRPSSASAARTATATRWIRQGWRGRQGSERTPRVLPHRGAHRPAPRRPHHASAA